MRNLPNPKWLMQLALFRPPLSSQRWEQLPREVQQQTVRLLATMLSEYWTRMLAPPATREARDE